MKKNMFRFSFVLTMALFLTTAAFADLGLAGLAAQPQGASQVGQAVLTAAKAVYANAALSDAEKQAQLAAILNEAAATGNESAIRYALVAVMMAGGAENLSTGIAAINASNAYSQYQNLTAATVEGVKSLMTAGGGAPAGGTSGGDTGGQGGGNEQGGGNNASLLTGLGVDPDNPFTWGSLTGPGNDGDTDATPR